MSRYATAISSSCEAFRTRSMVSKYSGTNQISGNCEFNLDT